MKSLLINSFFALAFVFSPFVTSAQSKSGLNDLLGSITTVEQANNLLISQKDIEGKVFSLNSTKDTNALAFPLFSHRVGFTFKIDNYLYKLLSIDSVLSFKVSYIYLSGEVYSKNQIDSVRSEIIAKYKNGTPFYELAMQYNMDGNFTGQLDWFQENMMVPEFEAAVKKHKKGDIFTVDTPSKQWYHVVLKNENDTFIKTGTLIRIRSSS